MLWIPKSNQCSNFYIHRGKRLLSSNIPPKHFTYFYKFALKKRHCINQIPQRNRINRREGQRQRDRDCEEPAPATVGTEKFKICRAGQWTGNSGKSWCGSLESKISKAGQQWGNSDRIAILWSWGQLFLLWETVVFAPKAFNWLDEAHPYYLYFTQKLLTKC